MSKEITHTQEELDRWYEITHLPDKICAIGEPHHFEEVFCYLIQGRDRDLLIDTGMGVKPLKPTLACIRDASKELVVVNTHCHFDHIGGNYEFDGILVPNDAWEVDRIKKGWTNEELKKNDLFDGFWHGIPKWLDTEAFKIRRSRKIKPVLKDKYIINLGDRQVVVIETPGHTPGSICLLDRESRRLFTSDLLYDGPLYCFEEESCPLDFGNNLWRLTFIEKSLKDIHPGHNGHTLPPAFISYALEIFDRISLDSHPDRIDLEKKIKEYTHPKFPRLKVLTALSDRNSRT